MNVPLARGFTASPAGAIELRGTYQLRRVFHFYSEEKTRFINSSCANVLIGCWALGPADVIRKLQ